jgi:hypothetical protein
MRRFLFTFFIGVSTLSASTVLVTSSSTLKTTDYVLWSQFGPDQTQIGQYFSGSSSQNDYGVSVALLNPAAATVLSAGTDWTPSGGINSGDALLSTDDGSEVGGPLQISFSKALYGGGVYIQGDGSGAFTARIQAFAGINKVLDEMVTSDNGDAIFLGAYDGTADLTRFTYSLTSAANGMVGDFVVDRFYLQTSSLNIGAPPPLLPPPVSPQVADNPEPAFTALVGFALVAFGLRVKKRFAR